MPGNSLWPFLDGWVTLLRGCWWLPTRGWKGHGLNHLLKILLFLDPTTKKNKLFKRSETNNKKCKNPTSHHTQPLQSVRRWSKCHRWFNFLGYSKVINLANCMRDIDFVYIHAVKVCFYTLIMLSFWRSLYPFSSFHVWRNVKIWGVVPFWTQESFVKNIVGAETKSKARCESTWRIIPVSTPLKTNISLKSDGSPSCSPHVYTTKHSSWTHGCSQG